MWSAINDWLTPYRLFWIVAVSLQVVAILRAITRGLGVERTLFWLLAIITLPGVGAIAYFYLGSPSIVRSRVRKQQTTRQIRQARSVPHPSGSHHAYNFDAIDAEFRPLEPSERTLLHLAKQLTGLVPSRRNYLEFLWHDETAFARIEEAIRSAKKFIWAEFYIIRNDATGYRFLDLLAEQAARGVEVRLIYDAFGSLWLDAGRLKKIRENGGYTEPFLPVNPLRRKWSVHLRNHRKVIVVDGEVGFTGGMNVGDEYSGRTRRRGGWHFLDSHLMLRGPAVEDLAQTFIEDWLFAAEEELPPPPAAPELPGARSVVAIVPSGPDQEHNANGWVYFAGIAQAMQRVYMVTPYFAPDEPTLRAIGAAALRGADVRLMVPSKNDVPLIGAAMRSYYKPLIDLGVRIFEYLPAMLHAKTIVVDGKWGIVGSANVDVRSFRLNFELGALVVDPDFAAVMEAKFLGELSDCREVTKEYLDQIGFLGRLRDGTARLLSPLM